MNKNVLMILLVIGLLIAVAIPALASGFSFNNPVHSGSDLVPPKYPAYGHNPNGCTPPLVLNSHGQCALPGDDTPPDPLPHRIGF